MINGIGSSSKGRVDLTRADATTRGAAAPSITAAQADGAGAVDRAPNRAGELAALGAPMDSAKIAAIRTAIANGRYPVDAKAIAEKMVALDLPLKF